MKDLCEWTGVQMVEVYIARKTLTFLGTLARYDEDRWEVQMLGAEVEARNEGKTSQRQMTMRQHYWKTIQKAMKHTQIPCERWHSEWRNVAPKKVDVQTKSEATARCEGTGLERPAEGIASLAADAGVQGAMGLGIKVCPKCGDAAPVGICEPREEVQWNAQDIQHFDAQQGVHHLWYQHEQRADPEPRGGMQSETRRLETC